MQEFLVIPAYSGITNISSSHPHPHPKIFNYISSIYKLALKFNTEYTQIDQNATVCDPKMDRKCCQNRRHLAVSPVLRGVYGLFNLKLNFEKGKAIVLSTSCGFKRV
jgi:hypothetical protein